MIKGRGGIEYEELVLGAGPAAERGCVVEVRYDLYLNRGDKIQESQSCSFRIGERSVIPGLEYGVEGMRLWGERRVKVRPHLGYGAQGIPGIVPPNAILMFHISLTGVSSERGVSGQ